MNPFYQESGVTIYCGDSREIMPSLGAGLVVTDPPFNIGYHYASYADNLTTGEYDELLSKTCRRPCVVIHYAEDICSLSQLFAETPTKMVAWVYNSNTPRQWRCVAWWGVQPDFTLAGQPYKNPTDKRVAALIEQGRESRLYDWWEVQQVKNVGSEKTDHPCQMPLVIMNRILRITPTDLVIDPFCGSGTTLVAAKELGIESIGIDLSERNCEIAADRLRQSRLF